MCRVTMGYLRVTIGHPRVTVGHSLDSGKAHRALGITQSFWFRAGESTVLPFWQTVMMP